MPTNDESKVYELHGAGRIPFPKPLSYGGGIFGGPPSPRQRAGVFVTHWALPSDMQDDVTIGGPLYSPARPATYAIRPSGAPIVGLAGLGAAGDAGGIFSMATSTVGALAIGAGVGAVATPASARVKGAAIGAVTAVAGKLVLSSFLPTALGSVRDFAVLGMILAGGYVGSRVAKML